MTAALALAMLAVGTYALRVVCITVISTDALPPAVRDGLAHVGPAVLAGLVVTILADGEGVAGLRLPLPQVLALTTAAVVAMRGGALVRTIAVAMVVLWVSELVVGI